MATPSPGNPIAASDLNSELGRSSGSQVSLGESAVRDLAGISSGQISYADLYDTSSAEVSLSGGSADSSAFQGGATASFQFRSDGEVYRTQSGNSSFFEDWVVPNSAGGSDYQIRFDLESGDTPSGSSLGSWHSLGSDRSINLSAAGQEILECTVRVRIRESSSGSVLADEDYSLRSDGF